MKKAILTGLIAILAWPWASSASIVITTTCSDAGVCSTTYYRSGQPIARQFGVGDSRLYAKLRGRIILATERNGEAYYVAPDKPVIYYLGNMDSALQVLLSQGKGMSNAGLDRIKVGIVSMYGSDADSDGLADKFEQAIGTNPRNFNTDGDTYSDFVEITHGYNPAGPGRLPINQKFTNAYKGSILLETQLNGEAWYVNPADSKRYFLSSKYDAHDLIKYLSIGISNADFNRLVD